MNSSEKKPTSDRFDVSKNTLLIHTIFGFVWRLHGSINTQRDFLIFLLPNTQTLPTGLQLEAEDKNFSLSLEE
ncbi:MAG TPA: hypothetical protein V6C63_11120 [Allocoleopsis sp.]